MFQSVEICAGGGGQALGLEMAGFEHKCLLEIDHHACATLKQNRPHWHVVEGDLKKFKGTNYKNIDLLAGGVPCPPFSIAGGQLGEEDERDLFPEALRLVKQINPKVVMLENVRGLFDPKFDSYRKRITDKLEKLNYKSDWKLIQSSDFGVPQLRPRTILIATRKDLYGEFVWPELKLTPKTVGKTLFDLMAANDWELAAEWANKANDIAPTLVGGSKKHGGPDLGPTRAKKTWLNFSVDGSGIADTAPPKGFAGIPKLTVRMAARIQGFPDDWVFAGKKTASYRQIGNAFPPPVAFHIGKAIFNYLYTNYLYEKKQFDSNRKKKISRAIA